MAMRIALFTDIIGMAAGTLRANKLRAALTILGVVIGITAIVGMTSLIRGFDESIKDSIRELGPNTLFVAKFSGLSFASGKEFKDLVKRPVLTVADAKAIEREAPSAGKVDVWLGAWGMPGRERAYYKGEKTKELSVIGVSENYAAVNFLKLATGRFFTESEVQHRRAVVVLGDTPTQALFPNVDPVGKTIRVGAVAYEVVGTVAKRTSPFGDNGGQDDFLVVPYTTFQKQFGWQRSGRVNINGTHDRRQRHAERDDRRRARRERHARGRDEGSRADHAHPPWPEARPGQRLRHHHAGRRPEDVRPDHRAPSSSASSSSRRSRSWSAASA